MILGLKFSLRRLYPLCRPYTRTCPALAARAAQSDGTKSKLVDLANKRHQGEIEGDRDAVAKHVEQTPAKQYQKWSGGEVRKLDEMVRAELRTKRLPEAWEEIGRQLGRSAQSCRAVYYKYARNQIKAESLDPKFYSMEVVQKAVLAIERHKQDVDSKGVVAIDWKGVAQEAGRPMLDVLNQLNSLLVSSKSNDAASAAQTNTPTPIPHIHIQQLQYPQEWLPSHVERLQQLLDDHKHERKDINIQVVSLYMGIDQTSCALALGQFYRKTDSVGIMDSRKPWTEAEEERLKEAVKAYVGRISWEQVSAKVGTRSKTACSRHWQFLGYIKTRSKKNEWTAEEIAHVTETIQNNPPGTRCRNKLIQGHMYWRLRENPESLVQCVDEMRDAEGNVDWSAVSKKM
ncbi:hypothetical protein LPJ56_006163, partial [Coemansia sp. RSA 2599]